MPRKYASPTGSPIIGTADIAPCRANIVGIHPDGTPEYAGDTTIFWDDQTTKTRDRKPLFLDEGGEEWTFDQLTPVEEE